MGGNFVPCATRGKFLEARRDGQTMRYRWYAGLREFVIPILRYGQVIAHASKEAPGRVAATESTPRTSLCDSRTYGKVGGRNA